MRTFGMMLLELHFAQWVIRSFIVPLRLHRVPILWRGRGCLRPSLSASNWRGQGHVEAGARSLLLTNLGAWRKALSGRRLTRASKTCTEGPNGDHRTVVVR